MVFSTRRILAKFLSICTLGNTVGLVTNHLLCEIYAIRHIPTLRIIVNINDEIKKLPYIEFTKLANVRKEILKLEQWETNKESVKKSNSVDIEEKRIQYENRF